MQGCTKMRGAHDGSPLHSIIQLSSLLPEIRSMVRVSQQRPCVCGRLANWPPTGLRWWRAWGHSRQLTGGCDLGAFHGLGKYTERRLALSVVHLVVVQVSTCSHMCQDLF